MIIKETPRSISVQMPIAQAYGAGCLEVMHRESPLACSRLSVKV